MSAVDPTDTERDEPAPEPVPAAPEPAPVDSEAIEPAAAAEIIGDAPAAGQRHVLIVEDEKLVALDMVEELKGLGWTVVGPAETLEEAQRLVETGVRIDAAILDINLHGRWVHALAGELNQRHVPFLICTGYELVDPDGRLKGAPIVEKPIMIGRLGTALDSLLRAYAPTPEQPEPRSA